MKTQSLFFSILLFLWMLSSCSSGPVMTQATGLAYEVVTVVDQASWESELGSALRSDLASDIPGLPQSEPSLKISYVQPKDFNGLLKFVRNILIVKVDPTAYTKVSLSFEKDLWAKNQYVLRLSAPDNESIVTYLQENQNVLSDLFVKEEFARTISLLKKEYSTVVMDNVKKDFGIELKVPANMTYFRDTTNFFWASNHANTGRTDVVVYTFPYVDVNTFTLDYLVAKRDSVMRENLPGAFPNSYMATETRAEITYKPITVDGQYCGVLRGLWKLEGDMMGGPFVAHVRLDEQNNRIVVVEGFVYAPETDKRNFIRRIEAALYTLKLPAEVAASASGDQKKKEEKN